MVQMVAENVMRPDSRSMDDNEHDRPAKFVSMMWPQMKEMEKANLEASLARSGARQRPTAPTANQPMATNGNGAKKPSIANLSLIHMMEMLSWGDAGVYLCIPGQRRWPGPPSTLWARRNRRSASCAASPRGTPSGAPWP